MSHELKEIDPMGSQKKKALPSLETKDFVPKLYEEICTNIRTSDDISFKLLGLVPLISSSGAAILALANIETAKGKTAVILISVVAAMITFGLYKWEMRNVQKCDWLIKRAAELEKLFFRIGEDQDSYKIVSDSHKIVSQFYEWSDQEKPPLFGEIHWRTKQEAKADTVEYAWYRRPIGKTQAERMIYWTSIAAWLVPIVIVLTK